jgi:hypothetical protein
VDRRPTPDGDGRHRKALILGDALSSGSKKRLTDWMIANKTSDARNAALAAVGRAIASGLERS